MRKGMAGRDFYWKLAGIVEMVYSYLGSFKTGKRGRCSAGKTKVVVVVEYKVDKAGFVKMSSLKRITGNEILKCMIENFEVKSTLCSSCWPSYGVLDPKVKAHKKVGVGIGPQGSKLLPWVYTMIANAKGILRGAYHGVSYKHLGRYLAEFCYRKNRHLLESQLFCRLLNPDLSTVTITFAELRE